MSTDTEALRERFEREFGKLPYEFALSRFPETGAWAGQYTSLKTQCGWEGYQAGHAAAKAETAAAVAKERERASVLYDMLLNRPALNAGLESEYAAWTSKCYQVTGAYKAAIRAGATERGE